MVTVILFTLAVAIMGGGLTFLYGLTRRSEHDYVPFEHDNSDRQGEQIGIALAFNGAFDH